MLRIFSSEVEFALPTLPSRVRFYHLTAGKDDRIVLKRFPQVTITKLENMFEIFEQKLSFKCQEGGIAVPGLIMTSDCW